MRYTKALCKLWLENMQDAFDGSWSNHSTLLPYRLSQAHPKLIHIEPETSFFSIDWTSEGIADLFLREVSTPENAYSIHLWDHLWHDKARKDFSDFHAKQLNIDYVKFAKTTYARNARRFLPRDCRPSLFRFWWEKLASKLEKAE